MKLQDVDQIIQQGLENGIPAAQLTIFHRGEKIHSQAHGWLDPDKRQHQTTLETRFDMASITKLFVVTAFMTLVEEGSIRLDDPVSAVLPGFSGVRPIQPYENPLEWGAKVTVTTESGSVDAGKITYRMLLTHTSGLPAWRPLKDQPDRESAIEMAISTFFSYPPGQRVVYSDIGLILTGLAIEQISGKPLDEVVAERVLQPLRLNRTGYLQVDQTARQWEGDFAPTEYCRWRGRRICGEVHDENAWRLGGVAGHAGIFSTSEDTAAFGLMFLQGGSPILQRETIAEMIRVQAVYQDTRRGIGFVLWSPDPEASSNPFSPSTYGHTGFTGTSLFMDPERELVVAFLTDEVYRGRENRVIMPLRVNLHRCIVENIAKG